MGLGSKAIPHFCTRSTWTYVKGYGSSPRLLNSASEKGVFWKRGPFKNVHFLKVLENLEILEILENLQTEENKGESDRFLETLETLEISPVKKPLS